MKSSEVLRWAYRHQAEFEFKKVESGVELTLTTQRKGVFSQFKHMLRDHDTAADEICRFIETKSRELNLE